MDAFVRAEIPDDTEGDGDLLECVKEHMLHTSCINNKTDAICIGADGKCQKHFPKMFSETTVIGTEAYPTYKRRDNGSTIRLKKGNAFFEVDNRFVVPYNPWLLKRYRCHTNVEVCASVKSVKYIYKYIHL